MRPYQINPPDGPWVDLDHVLMAYPPDVSTSGYSFSWHMAFMSERQTFYWNAPILQFKDVFPDSSRVGWEGLDELRPHQLAFCEDEAGKVFGAFFNAWIGGGA